MPLSRRQVNVVSPIARSYDIVSALVRSHYTTVFVPWVHLHYKLRVPKKLCIHSTEPPLTLERKTFL